MIQKPGQNRWLGRGLLTAKHQHPVNLWAYWRPDEDEPWLLATNLPTQHVTRLAYRRRMWIEEMFGDLKGHGFDLEKTHLILGMCTGCGSPEIAATTALSTTLTETATSLPGDTTAEILPPRTVTPTVTLIALGNKVTFTTEDGVQLAGTLFGEGEPVVILAHQGTPGANQTDWYAFAQVLAEHGYTALAFDFRGNGKSSGLPDRNKLDLDLAAALQFIREQGHTRIVCIGASMGGTTCIRKALDGERFEGLVALGSAMITAYGTGIWVSEEELASLTVPKLFITAEKDSSLVINDITRMYESSPEPKALCLLPGSVHGTDLFDTDASDELTTILLEFLENLPDP